MLSQWWSRTACDCERCRSSIPVDHLRQAAPSRPEVEAPAGDRGGERLWRRVRTQPRPGAPECVTLHRESVERTDESVTRWPSPSRQPAPYPQPPSGRQPAASPSRSMRRHGDPSSGLREAWWGVVVGAGIGIAAVMTSPLIVVAVMIAAFGVRPLLTS